MVFIMRLCPQHEAIVTRFRNMGERFFHKVMTRATVTELVKGPYAYQLEFPLQFLNDHADQFTENTVVEIPDCPTKWPLRISVRYFRSVDKNRVFAYGDGGWRKFVLENDVKVGDLVIFTLIGFSKFKVFVFPGVENHANNNVRVEDSQEIESEESIDESLNSAECPTCGQSRPCHRFVTTVQPSHSVREDSSGQELRLEVPASFWQRHRRMLRGEVVRLKGPNQTVMKVKHRTSTRGRHGPRVRLETGWKNFFVANRLLLGDNLLFSLTGPSRFDVEVLDRYPYQRE